MQTFFQDRLTRDQEEGHHQHPRRHGSQEHRPLLPRDPAAPDEQPRLPLHLHLARRRVLRPGGLPLQPRQHDGLPARGLDLGARPGVAQGDGGDQSHRKGHSEPVPGCRYLPELAKITDLWSDLSSDLAPICDVDPYWLSFKMVL